jgi:hypothetical protein
MVINDAQLNKFIELYQKEHGVLLERTQALESFQSLIVIVEIMHDQRIDIHKTQEIGYNRNATHKVE